MRYLIERIARSALILLAVTLLTFLLADLAPGDQARSIAGDGATPEQVERVREELGLDRHLLVRYADFVGSTLRGDLGNSLIVRPGTPALELVGEAVPVTLSISVVGLLLAVAVAIPLGVLAALRVNSIFDRLLTGFTSVAVALPPFVVGPLLVGALAVNRDLFPVFGYAPMAEGLGEWARHLVLPAVTLAVIPLAELARQARGATADVLNAPYIESARTRGIAPRRLLVEHVGKNAAAPVLTVFGLQITRMLAGAVVVETVFNLPGLGTLAVRSVVANDTAIIQAIVVLSAAAVLVTNLLVDATHEVLNPRLRHA